MARRRASFLIGSLVAQALALWVTALLPGFGVAGWHHVASLIVVLVLATIFWKPLSRSRRILAIGVLASTILAAASGFWLLYWKEGIRAAGYQDWGVFWHVAWSWAASVFFFQHTWINRVALAHFFRRSFSTGLGGVTHVGLYVCAIAAFLVTWSSIGKGWFTVESYIPLSLYAWLIATAPPYALWSLTAALGSRVAWLARWDRARLRGPVDLLLVPIAALATLSGVPLTWFDPFMDQNGWKYVSKFWHVWPSVAFTVLVFAHSVHVWNTMRAHWRGVGVAVGDLPARKSAPAAGVEPA